MLFIAVGYILGWLLAIFSAFLLIPIAFALANEEWDALQAFLQTGAVTTFIGGGLILALKGNNVFEGRRYSLLMLSGLWVIIPVAGAVPFLLSIQQLGPVAAYFEAVSGFTTTGATIFTDLTSLPRSIIIWRSLLQWLGGLATLLSLVLILVPLTGPEFIDRQLRIFGRVSHNSQHYVFTAVQNIVPIYSSLTLICFILLLLAKIPVFDAFCLSLSTLSTGGFMPREGTIALYGSPLAEIVLAFFMFCGAVSMVWLRAFVFFNWKDVKEVREPFWIAGIIIAFGILLAIPLMMNSPEQGFRSVYHAMTLGLATAASLISTTGFAISERTQEIIPYMGLLLICIIGGGRFSTAGGLKIHRLGALLRASWREVGLLIYPHGINSDIQARSQDKTAYISGISASFAVSILAIAILSLILSHSFGPFSASLLAAVSAIGNIGPAYNFVGSADFADAPLYRDMAASAQLSLSFGMIIGRVELLALLSLFNLSYWRV